MFESLLKSLFGSKHDRDVRRVEPIVEQINQRVEGFRDLSDADLQARLSGAPARPAAGETPRSKTT